MKHKELAGKFLRVAQDFEDFVIKNNLAETAVDMDEPCDKREEEVNLCDTPACHGGWAAIMYSSISPTKLERKDEFYVKGADILADKLGFVDHIELEDWARVNLELWGNDFGGLLFCSELAFDKNVPGDDFIVPLHLTDIIQHYRDVAKRLLEEPDLEVNNEWS
jgi:hypothetical protein